MCSFFVFFFSVIYVIQLRLFETQIFLHIDMRDFLSFNVAVNTFVKFLENFEIMVVANLRKNFGPTILKQSDELCLQENQEF